MRKGVIPDKPYNGERVISAKVSPQFQKRLREFAVCIDASVATVVKTAVYEYMVRNADHIPQ